MLLLLEACVQLLLSATVIHLICPLLLAAEGQDLFAG
jgi:hypothetical protein